MLKRILVVCLILALAGFAAAEEKKEKKSWLERTEFKGDLRLRYEGFDQEDSFDDDRRDRFRFRFRWGFKTKVNDIITLGAQLRSGDPDDPVSDNQSLDGGLTKKDISIAEAFAAFKLSDEVSLTAGKFGPKALPTFW